MTRRVHNNSNVISTVELQKSSYISSYRVEYVFNFQQLLRVYYRLVIVVNDFRPRSFPSENENFSVQLSSALSLYLNNIE